MARHLTDFGPCIRPDLLRLLLRFAHLCDMRSSRRRAPRTRSLMLTASCPLF
jgi:hypothetical protein